MKRAAIATAAEALFASVAIVSVALVVYWYPDLDRPVGVVEVDSTEATGDDTAEPRAPTVGELREPSTVAQLFVDPAPRRSVSPPEPEPVADPREPEPPPERTEELAFLGTRRSATNDVHYYFTHRPTGTVIELAPGEAARGWRLLDVQEEAAIVERDETRYRVELGN